MKKILFAFVVTLCMAHAGFSQIAVTVAPEVTGLAVYDSMSTSTLVATVFTVKATPGVVGGFTSYNGAATVCFLQFFNATAANVTVGTTAPAWYAPMPATGGSNLLGTIPLKFHSTAITVASTTTATGATPCGTATVVTFFYK